MADYRPDTCGVTNLLRDQDQGEDECRTLNGRL